MTLTEFLLARIAEDEAAARAASPGPWNFGSQYADAAVWMGDDHSMGIAHASWEYDQLSAPNFAHIARHDPSRVLAECEAKRRTVERLLLVQQGDSDEHAWHEQGLFEAVGYLASVYADHPDYREEWRP